MDPSEAPVPIACLLASAGGLDPLQGFFKDVPKTSGIAYLVLQHHGQDQQRHLPSLLERQGAIPFRLAQPGDEVLPDQALILSGGMVLAWAGNRLQVLHPEPVGTSGHPGDLLFQSLAECVGDRAIGVVLSGAGQDGTAGLRAIQAGGGLTLAQDPATAAQDGMPRQAVEAGVVAAALPVELLFARIREEALVPPSPSQATEDIQAICAILARQSGNDFSQYKPGTLSRRVQRRMAATGAKTAAVYRALLEGSKEEVRALENDLLIGVTEFFRDEEAFAALMTFLDPLLRSGDEGPLRIWVPGCASGEEAYTLAILIREVLEGSNPHRRVQIFGTDLDSTAIMQAKAGRFSARALRQVSPERLDRFFTRERESWVAGDALRAMCSFSLQNLLRDPPYSSLHLVSCRNVLIYLKPALQAKLIPLFHFALKPGGLLFLGNSEGLASNPSLFDPLDPVSKIFVRRDVDRPPMEFPMGDRRLRLPEARLEPATAARSTALSLFEQMLLTHYLPASALVNEQGEILFWAGQIGRYLTSVPGQPSLNILDNTSGTLHWELRRLLARVKEDAGGSLRSVVNHDTGQGQERLRLTLRPMPGMDREAGIYALIVQTDGGGEVQALPGLTESDQQMLDRMNLELQNAREELQGTVEELAATNEELQSSNEELQSSNEELQASQEELRSVNDDLFGRNRQLGQTIQELSEANGDLQNLMGSTNIPTLFLDGNLAISRFTPSATQLFGLIETDLGRPIRNLLPLFTGMDLPALAREVLDRQQIKETQVQSLDGDRWFLVRFNPYWTAAGTVSGVVVTFFDITEIRRAQMMVTESEERYRSLFESSLAVLMVVDPASGAILSANAAAASFYGWPRAVLESMTIQDINLLPADEARSNLAQVLAHGPHVFPYRHRLADGRIRDVEVLSSPISVMGSPCLYKIIQDVTERKQAEDLVREARTKLEAALARMADAVFISDREGRFVDFNEAFASFHRFPDKASCLSTFAEYPGLLEVFLPGGELAPIGQWAVPRALRGETAVNQEYTLRRKDTGETWVGSYNFAPLLDSEGLITGSVVTARDITAQKATERALIESEERFRSVFDNSPDAVLIRKAGGCFMEANQIALDRYGYTREEIRRMTPEDLVPPRLQGQVDQRIRESLRTGVPAEWVHMRKDGTEIPVELLLKSFTLNGESYICASARDVSERRRAEAEKVELQDQLQQSNKMESLGRLAGGIAHDLNNVLGSIFAVAELLKPHCSSDPEDAECLAVLERAAQRGRDLVKGLVGFARKEPAAKVPVDLNELVRKEVVLLEHTLLQKYQLVTDLEEGLPAVQGEPGSLGNALMNLCVNAVDAMPEGGSLGIRTHHAGQGAIQLVVEDTGQGMSPEVVRRAMEPFYTTKPVGQGTGLGLSNVFNTVRAHGGTLTINSQEGKGTQIVVTLPIEAAEPGVERAGNPQPASGSALTILVVDDDELIRSTMPLMLRVMGHQVEAVDGGRAALDHLSREGLPDLVILDQNMPDMTGTETLRHIRAQYRDLPVLLATGFVEPGVERLVEADPSALIIGKPFSFDEIQRKFGELGALGSPGGGVAPPLRPGLPRLRQEGLLRPGPAEPLTILLIEDNAIDALSIEGLLKKRSLPFHVKRIQTEAELDAALEQGGIDIILSDFRLPSWSGMAALRRVRAFDPGLIFILLSAEVDEGLFDEAMREGANDFLFKDRIYGLVPAILRETSRSRCATDS